MDDSSQLPGGRRAGCVNRRALIFTASMWDGHQLPMVTVKDALLLRQSKPAMDEEAAPSATSQIDRTYGYKKELVDFISRL